MPTAEFTTQVPAPLADVWAWHEDVEAALPSLTPPGKQARLVSAEPLPPRVGTVVTLEVKVPILGWKKWIARYTEHEPPTEHETREAWFTDHQDEGPFKTWDHTHHLAANPDGTTTLTDRITYTPPLGPLGRLGDLLIIRRDLRQMFAHRHKVTREYFATTST